MKNYRDFEDYLTEKHHEALNLCRQASDDRVKPILEALEALHATQNGSPLIKYQHAWELAMIMTEDAIDTERGER